MDAGSEAAILGVLLVGFGGPETPEDIAPFLRSILGPRATPDAIERAQERYRAIGGHSPLPAITRAQARSLQTALGPGYAVRHAFLHSGPTIPESLRDISNHGIKEVLGLSLSPHESSHTTWAYKREAEASARNMGLRFRLAGPWHTHPLYALALAEKVRGEWDTGPAQHLLITAHSLPLGGGEDVGAYAKEVGETVQGLYSHLEGPLKNLPWSLAYQSRSPGPGEWLGPSVEEALEGLSQKGIKDVLVLPVSFVSDHLETLYDVDILYREKTGSLGMRIRRVPAPNDSPAFIRALCQIVLEVRAVV